jgi:hypothetical protein
MESTRDWIAMHFASNTERSVAFVDHTPSNRCTAVTMALAWLGVM